MSTSSSAAAASRPYHHGNLPEALLDAAAAVVQERGPAGVSLREVARRAGVSHSAPAHHFGDKAGLLTAVAREGFRRFLVALASADEASVGRAPDERLLEIGVAYVRFAVDNPAYFAVMWRSDLQDPGDPAVVEFAVPAFDVLQQNVEAMQATGWRADEPVGAVAVGCWSVAHGLATLWLEGALAGRVGGDIEALAGQILGGYLRP